MRRITTDSPKDNIETALNLFYIKDNWTWVRGGGPAPEFPDVSLCDYVRDLAKKNVPDLEFPSDDYKLSDLMAECLMDGTETMEGVFATLYTAGWAFAELRYKLKAYEDTGLVPEEVVAMQYTVEAHHKEADPLLRAKALDRLLVLPAAPGETVYYADEDAGRVMMGYINGYRIRNNGAMSFEFFNLELDVEWHSISLPVGEFGKTVFLKEEEAEKVMEAGEPDD